MAGKYKMTGCARFAIFLVILLPIAYFGAKYLRESGTWDKIKDKVENTESNSVEKSIESKREKIDIPPVTESITGAADQDQFDRLRAAYEEQELIIARQDQTIKDLQLKNEALSKRLNEAPAAIPPVTTPSTRTNNQPSSTGTTSGAPSLDDLLREADSNLGTSASGSRDSETSSLGQETLATWSFVFNNTRGEIAFMRQGDRVLAKTTYSGSNRVDISELSKSGDRFTVDNSQTGEYYVVRQDGNLDAYDRSGFQTTCQRK